MKDTVFHKFTVSVLDNKSEGILWALLLDQASQHSISLCVCYLPPSNSSRGDISLEFFSNLRLQVSKYQGTGLLCICGDFNARIGSLADIDLEAVADSVPKRVTLDTAPPNTHGKELIEFVRDVGMVVLNGRGSSNNDSFTFISTNGSSVVDYCLIPIEQWNLIGPFSVVSPLDVSHRFHIPVDCNLPDHSILLWSIKLDSQATFNRSQNPYSPNPKCKFKIPQNYMQSDLALSRIQDIIDNTTPLSLQTCYKDTCDLIFSELIPSNPSKHKKCCHPWWNPRLNLLKQSLRLKQRAWLKQKDNSQLKLAYQSSQKTFDKAIKKAKADHRTHKQIELLHQCKHDSKSFWRNFKLIGIHAERKTIPIQVINAEGEVLSEPSALLQVWKSYFDSLYNQSSLSVPSTIYSLLSSTHMPANSSNCQELNLPISIDEVELAIARLNLGKAPGLGKIQGSYLNHPALTPLLHRLFSVCFDSALVPSDWCSALIHPILKPNTTDPRNPINYRGIALQSVVLKVFCKVLNARLSDWSETNCILSDEQNGFRPNRSCLDHLFVICSIISTRKLNKSPTFVAFVDLKKAFDSVDRDLLWLRLGHYGISGKFLDLIKCLYRDTEYCVRVNDTVTEPFPVTSGVKQGCLLSPTLFNLFINSLIEEIKQLNLGVKCGEILLALLMFADDIAIMAETEEDLQCMLSTLHTWCESWRLHINTSKTKIVHFRHKSQPRTSFNFKCGPSELEVVPSYKYLGVWLDEHLDYQNCVNALSESARKALGLLIAKSKQFGNFPFEAFSSLYDSLVIPRMDYGAGVWGYRTFPKLQTIQNKAIRHILGVGKNCPVDLLEGDSGWMPVWCRHQFEMLKLWFRLATMDDSRLTKKIFKWSLELANKGKPTWCFHANKLLTQINLGHLNPNNVTSLSPKEFQTIVITKLTDKANHKWRMRIWDHNTYCTDSGGRLHNYRVIKQQPRPECYISGILCRGHRWVMAALRGGCLPLHIETGRYRTPKTPYHLRTCRLCSSDTVETEFHFVMLCPALDHLRSTFFSCLSDLDNSFTSLTLIDKFKYILSANNHCRIIGKHLYNLYKTRIQLLNL